MSTMQSKDIVREIGEEDGTLLVTFLGHDGYFRVTKSAAAPALKERIRKALRDKEEISFTFDRDLRILEIAG